MGDVDLLESALTKTTHLVANVDRPQWDAPTPCETFDVHRLVGHMVGYARVFAAAANGEVATEDPDGYDAGNDAADHFREAAGRMVSGWRENGFDRTVRMIAADLPAPMVFGMTLIEYVTHGWDLAVATGQPVPYTDDEAEQTLARPKPRCPTSTAGPTSRSARW